MMLGLGAVSQEADREYVCLLPFGSLMCGAEGSDNKAVMDLIEHLGCVPRDRVHIIMQGEGGVAAKVPDEVAKRLTGHGFCSEGASTMAKIPTPLLIAGACLAGFLLLGGNK